MGVPFKTGFSDLDFDREITPHSTLGESLSAAWDLSQLDTTTSAIGRLAAFDEAEEADEPYASPLEIRRSGLPFVNAPKEFMKMSVAKRLSEQQMERVNLDKEIASGPKGFFMGLATFGSQAVPHFIDPVNLGASLLTGGVFNLLAAGTKLGRAIGVGAQYVTYEQSFARSLAEGIVGNLAVEPFVLVANRQELQDYTAYDSLVNASIGAFGFAGLRYGGGKVFRYFAQGKAANHAAMFKVAAGQLMRNEPVNLEPFRKAAVGEINGKQVTSYQWTRVDNPNDVEWYMPAENATNNIENARGIIVGQDLGNAVYLVMNRNRANGYSASNIRGYDGSYHAVKYDKLVSLDLESPLPDELVPLFKEFVGKDYDFKKGTGKDIMDFIDQKIRKGELKEEAFEELNALLLRDTKYNSYKYVQTDHLGDSVDPDNVLVVFGKDAPRQDIQSYKADKSKVPMPSKREAIAHYNNYDAPELKRGFNQTEHDRILAMERQEIGELKEADLDSMSDEFVSDLKERQRLGLLPEEALKELEVISKLRLSRDQWEKAIKAAEECMK